MAALTEAIGEDYKRAIDIIVEISTAGRAPSNDPAIFALALAAGWNRTSSDPEDEASPSLCSPATEQGMSYRYAYLLVLWVCTELPWLGSRASQGDREPGTWTSALRDLRTKWLSIASAMGGLIETC